MKPRTPGAVDRLVASILLVAGAVALATTFGAARASQRLHEDERDYLRGAAHLLHTGVLSFASLELSDAPPEAYREPGYPMLLALSFRLAGHSLGTTEAELTRQPASFWGPVRALNLGLAAIAALATGLAIARLAGLLPGAATFACVASSPALGATVPLAMTELLAAAHVALAALCLVALAQRARGAPLATGVVFGLLPWVRAEASLLLPIAFIVAAISSWKLARREHLLRLGALTAGLLLPGTLWVARNAAALGHPVLADRSGLALAVRAELDAEMGRVGVPSALLSWTPIEAAHALARERYPAAYWLDFHPRGTSHYFFATLERWRNARRAASDPLTVDASFRRQAIGRFLSHPAEHLAGAVAVAWRGLFAERSPAGLLPLDLAFLWGLLAGGAFLYVTLDAARRRAAATLVFLLPAWVLFLFHASATEFLPRYAVPLLPLAWGAIVLASGRLTRRAVPFAGPSTEEVEKEAHMHARSLLRKIATPALTLAVLLGALPLEATTPVTPQKTAGKVTVDGKPLGVNYAYLFHAPDNWEEGQVNPVVVITAKPLDTAKLKQAKTLRDALQLAPERVVIEARPGGKADLSICHPAFGDGMCYSTSVMGADEWKEEAALPGHFGGRLRVFGGNPWKVLDKYELFYELTFDAAQVADFKTRR